VRGVARSEPTFRRRLLFALVLFTALFVADLFLLGHLAFRDLGHRVIDQAFRASLAALETQPPYLIGAISEDAGPAPPVPVEPCLPGDPQTSVLAGTCVPTPLQGSPQPQIFRRQTSWSQRVMADTRGQILWIGSGQADRLEIGPAPPPRTSRLHSEVREEWEMGDRRQQVIALHQPASPGSNVIREVGIPRELIDKELADLERDLQVKLWIGAGIAVLILVVAFLYVLRLLHRTRLLEAQAQMDDRLAFVGALAAGLAHEIRNPLNVLSMNLQMLEEDLGTKLSGDGGETRVFLAALQGEVRRLSNLVNNFLSYARPHQPRFESKDLNGLLRELCQFVRPEFESRGLTLRQDLSPYLPPVDLDEALIRQAVLNILINASQVLKPGGTATVETRVGAQGEAVIAISDDGPGIASADRERIFEVFYSSRGGGTGLGLPIAARILEAHGGSIAVDSAPGRGARFLLTLPRRHAAPAVAPATSTPATSERS
jgi:signal transduction histidine kinase